tara:strand:- start:1631 stop:2032 length:402 start_codon:yes stop_codon:yes gene_type:complete
MSNNKYKEIESEKAQSSEPKSQSKGLKSLLTGSFLSREQLVDALPFVFFLTFLGICYIANGYQAEKVVRRLYNTNNEVKELRSEYITTKSELMLISKQSQVARSTASIGLRELTSPPKKIVINEKRKNKIIND